MGPDCSKARIAECEPRRQQPSGVCNDPERPLGAPRWSDKTTDDLQQPLDLPSRRPHPEITERLLAFVERHCGVRPLVRINTVHHRHHRDRRASALVGETVSVLPTRET